MIIHFGNSKERNIGYASTSFQVDRVWNRGNNMRLHENVKRSQYLKSEAKPTPALNYPTLSALRWEAIYGCQKTLTHNQGSRPFGGKVVPLRPKYKIRNRYSACYLKVSLTNDQVKVWFSSDWKANDLISIRNHLSGGAQLWKLVKVVWSSEGCCAGGTHMWRCNQCW